MALIPHPMVAGIAGFCFGCLLFAFDTVVETLGVETPWLLNVCETIEFLLTAPGIGAFCYLLTLHLQRSRANAQTRLHAEREQHLLVLGRLAAAVAHEVRNPLHNLRLAVDEQRSELPTLRDHPLHTHIDDAIARIDHAVELVYQLARPVGQEGGACDLARVARDACAALALRCNSQVATRLIGAEQPVMVRTSAPATFIMVDNLLRNAVEAAGETAITLTIIPGAGMVALRVTNPGVLPDGTCDAAGRPLATTSTKTGGLGLGLSIAMQLVEAASGSLRLQSQAGTVVAELTLPSVPGRQA